MTVRADGLSECGHYSAFGWIYVADESEKGGRYSFRRVSCPSVQNRLDELQNECEVLLGEIRRIGGKARVAGFLAASVAAVIGLIAFINGMNMCIGDAIPFKAAVSVFAGVFAAVAAYPVYSGTTASALAGRGAERDRLAARVAQLCGEARKILGKSC